MRRTILRRVIKLEKINIPDNAVRTIIVQSIGINEDGRRFTTGGLRWRIGKEGGQPEEKLPASFFDDEDLNEERSKT
jgi:hypothetical protein